MPHTVQHGGESRPDALIRLISQGSDDPIDLSVVESTALRRPEFAREAGEIVEAFPSSGPRTILLGIGKGSPRELKIAGSRLFAAIIKRKIETVHFSASTGDAAAFGQGIGEGLQIGAGPFKLFPGSAGETPDHALNVRGLDETFDKGLQRGLQIGEAANLSRRLATTPPNVATPKFMAEEAQKLADQFSSLTIEIIEGDRLESEQMAGHLSVGRASSNPPCIIVLRYQPENGESDQKPVVLLGKTITYDTGGLSIKTKNGMPGMKYDKSGGCAVLGAMQACAQVVKPNFPVTAILVAAENSISSNAYRPDDVITYRNGVTVEITNTDAEGRLVLADGLCWAVDKENPACIVDIATLTGGVVTALGSTFGGLFSTDDALAEEVSTAGERSGEWVWRLPHAEAYRKMMRSEVADIKNSDPGGKAHPCQGAAFLTYFCPPELPYAHIDMAGVSHLDKGDYGLDGASGFGVGLFTEFLSHRRGN